MHPDGPMVQNGHQYGFTLIDRRNSSTSFFGLELHDSSNIKNQLLPLQYMLKNERI
jgi:hypothetical protein